MNPIFQWLFKLKFSNYSEGTLIFEAGRAIIPYLVLAILIAVSFLVVYRVARIYTTKKQKAISFSLKITALLLICLPLVEPSLLMPDIIPNTNFLAVLVDNSESMTIKDGKLNPTRLGDAQYILNDKKNGIIKKLQDNFKVRVYSFSTDITRTDSVAYLTGTGTGTNFSTALKRVLDDFKGLPLGGVVMLTDGADNSTDSPLSDVEHLKSLNIPMHIVGLGNNEFKQERELLDVTFNRGLRVGAGTEISVKMRSWIKEREPAKLSLYKGDKLVHTEVKNLSGNGKTDNADIFYEPENNEAAEYIVQIEKLPDEINTDNNAMNLLINTEKDSIRVLFVEGHPRAEFKFIKRALENDPVFEFTSLVRTGGGKFYRQGIYSSDELKDGFPTTFEELYKFRAIIFGDIEYSFFTLSQVEMLEQFVGKRGGGFMMTGAANSFAEGDYWDTPIEDILPIFIDPRRRHPFKPDFYNPDTYSDKTGMEFRPTPAGLEHPILKLANDPGTSRAKWAEMPKISNINLFGGIKPGAVVLAEKPEDTNGPAEPLLVIQRYGKGRTAALATSSTWRWKMQKDSENTDNERFWRQLVRWLVAEAPHQVNIYLEDKVYAPQEEVPVRVTVYDKEFNPLNAVEVHGTVTDPFGSVKPLQFHPDLTSDGEYVAPFVPQEQGVYKVDVDAVKNGKTIGKHHISFLTRTPKKEYFNATLKKKYLQSLAETNGGFYYDAASYEKIPENLVTHKSSVSVYRKEYLWDMPILFLLALCLLSAEWIYRRRKGLP